MQPSKPKFFSMNSYTPSNSSITPIGYSSTSTNDQPKSKTKLLIIVLIAAVILISIFAILGGGGRSKKENSIELEEFYSTLYDFGSDYDAFLELYDTLIGFDSEFQVPIGKVFLLADNDLDEISEQKEELSRLFQIITDYDEDSSSELSNDQKKAIKTFKEQSSRNLDIIYGNLDTIINYYQTFFSGIYAQMELDTPKTTCTDSDEIRRMANSDDEEVSRIATVAKEIYCNYITQVSKKTDTGFLVELYGENREKIQSVSDYVRHTIKSTNREELVLSKLIDDIFKEENNEN